MRKIIIITGEQEIGKSRIAQGLLKNKNIFEIGGDVSNIKRHFKIHTDVDNFIIDEVTSKVKLINILKFLKNNKKFYSQIIICLEFILDESFIEKKKDIFKNISIIKIIKY